MTINNAQIGIDITIGDAVLGNQGVGSYSIIDAVVSNTPTFIRLSKTIAGQLDGSLVLNNIKLTNVPNAVAVNGGSTIVSPRLSTIAAPIDRIERSTA